MEYLKRRVDTESAKLYWQAEVRSVSGRKISGIIYYNKWSVDLGGFREKIAPGAFTIEDPAYLLWSHDAAKPLASTGNGSLELQDTPAGLKFSATIPSTQAGNDALENVRSGLVKGVSFGFMVQQDDWSDDDRTITDARLSEISLVTFPAYKANVAEARSQKQDLEKFFRARKERKNRMKALEEKVDRFFAEGFEYSNYLGFFNALQRRAEYQEDDPKLDKRASGLSTTDMPALPGELVNKLLQPQNVSPLWTMATKIPIGGGFNSIQIPAWSETTRSGSLLGGVQFEWMEEAGGGSYNIPSFRQLNMNLWKCMGLIPFTAELREDGVAFDTVMENALQSGLNSLVEEMVIRGTGAGQPLGIMNAGCTIEQAKETNQEAATIYAENVTNMISHLPPESIYQAVGIAHPTTLQQLSQLNLGGPLFHYRQGGEKYHKLCGLDLIFSEHCSPLGTAGDLIFADLSQMIVTYKPVREQMSIHVLFSTAEEVYKVVMRWNAQPAWSKSITPAQGSTKISPFVVLADRS